MTQLSPLAHLLLERLLPQAKEYRYPLVAAELGATPREWLDAVQSLVKWHYAEAQNINRDVVAVRHTLGDHPLLYAGEEQRIYMRKVMGSEQRPLWIKEVGGKVVPTTISVVDPTTLKVVDTVSAVGYMRYEDQWIIEVVTAGQPIPATVAIR